MPGFQEEETAATPEVQLDLKGVPEELHELLIESASNDDIDEVLAAARRVMPNPDGTVGIVFRKDYKGAKGNTSQVKLRAMKARDYIDGTTRDLVNANDMGATLEFGMRLSSDPAAVQELDRLDSYAIYLGVRVLRKNWSSPKP